MDNQILLKKFHEFTEYIENFMKYYKSGIEDIHKLRVSAREIFSLISINNLFYSRLKKIIKLSNKIRDTDVFHELYLSSLPKKYTTKLDLKKIKNSTDISRGKSIAKLHSYLKSLLIPKTIKFKYEKPKFKLGTKNQLISLNNAELHKYRIFIKKELYKENNSFPLNEIKIKTLKRIKDILGTIHDNNNAIERLNSFDIEVKLFRQIESFTKKKNLKLLKSLKY